MSYRYSSFGNWGELCGLTSTDLTEEQLKKIKFEKLIEFSYSDPRVDKIVGDKVVKCSLGEIGIINKLNEDELSKTPYLISQYNKYIKYKNKLPYKGTVYRNGRYIYRHTYIFWSLLDESNKVKEISRWIDGSKSVVNIKDIDFGWLFKKYIWVANRVAEKIFKNISCAKSKIINNIIENLTEEMVEKYTDQYGYNSHILTYFLANKYIPHKYVIKVLRYIAGRKKLPNTDAILSKSALLELPSVMRLEALEALFFTISGKVSFSDISTDEEFASLLFGTSIRYNDRVKRVVNYFKHCNKELNNEYIS